jgi:hypothetical protein
MRNLHFAGREIHRFSRRQHRKTAFSYLNGWRRGASKKNNDGYLVLGKDLKGIGTGCTKVYTFDF